MDDASKKLLSAVDPVGTTGFLMDCSDWKIKINRNQEKYHVGFA